MRVEVALEDDSGAGGALGDGARERRLRRRAPRRPRRAAVGALRRHGGQAGWGIGDGEAWALGLVGSRGWRWQRPSQIQPLSRSPVILGEFVSLLNFIVFYVFYNNLYEYVPFIFFHFEKLEFYYWNWLFFRM